MILPDSRFLLTRCLPRFCFIFLPTFLALNFKMTSTCIRYLPPNSPPYLGDPRVIASVEAGGGGRLCPCIFSTFSLVVSDCVYCPPELPALGHVLFLNHPTVIADLLSLLKLSWCFLSSLTPLPTRTCPQLI